VKGKLSSGFCSPTLTWAHAAGDARVTSNAAIANFIDIPPYFYLLPNRTTLSDATRCCRSYTTAGIIPNKYSTKRSAEEEKFLGRS
jgi:hypothetical protein